jgi:hypothetical protein
MTELMSTDIGDVPAGLDPEQPGSFPIGTLRLGPTPTTVQLVDAHDNDGLGQVACEALYVRNLIIDAGATLDTGGCMVYYVTVSSEGTIITANRLDQIVLIPGDYDADADVDLADYVEFPDCVTGPAVGGLGLGCEVFDFDDNDRVDLRDFAAFQVAFTGP